MPGDNDADVDSKVTSTAARLFGELGYDALDTNTIADACGLDAEILIAQYGGKRGLYQTVIKQAADLLNERMTEVMRVYPPGIDGVIGLFDGYLNFALTHPQTTGLWMYRWLLDAQDFPQPEARSNNPVLGQWVTRVDEIIPDDLDAMMTWRMLTWMINIFVRGGMRERDGSRRSPDDPQALRQFRDHLHRTIQYLAS